VFAGDAGAPGRRSGRVLEFAQERRGVTPGRELEGQGDPRGQRVAAIGGRGVRRGEFDLAERDLEDAARALEGVT
jgi:hypothetical protein